MKFSKHFVNLIRNNIAGVAQLVERNLAKVDVAGSSPVSRSVAVSIDGFFWRRTQVVRERSAKPLCISSNLIGASNYN